MNRPWVVLPLIYSVLLLIHGSLIGITDDEAYYWMLSQKPAWGFAYHPPAVAWMIALSEFLFGWIPGLPLTMIVRLPAVLISGVLLSGMICWLRQAGVLRNRLSGASVVLMSFPGLYAVSWMMVPDLPMVLGWLFLFLGTWGLCSDQTPRKSECLLFVGAAWILISKLSGVFALASSFLCLWFWVPKRIRYRALLILGLGSAVGLVPFLIWNAQNEWGALLYQVRDRHSGEFSLTRYARFWLILFVAVGPPLTMYLFVLIKRVWKKKRDSLRVEKFLLIWALPAASVFCIQPAFSDFKPHWALMVWLPISAALAFSFGRGKDLGQARFQTAFSAILAGVVILACHVPLVGWVMETMTGKPGDPRWDITNDLYTWESLPIALEDYDSALLALPILGSRYQTASQAAFALRRTDTVARVPRSRKEWKEWPKIPAVEHPGPEWPGLKGDVLFVTDNRYHQPPEFRNSHCENLFRHATYRGRFPAKWIDIWRCSPQQNSVKTR